MKFKESVVRSGRKLILALPCLFLGDLDAAVVFSNLPTPPAAADFNIFSLGFAATSTSEVGEHVSLAGTDRDLTSVIVGMSSFSRKSEFATVGDASSYTHELTANIYAVDSTGILPVLGSVIASKTIQATIPYRPEAYGFNGIYFTTEFDFTTDGVVLPDEIVFSIRYNTQNGGPNPIGANGPYNKLNTGIVSVNPTIGTDEESGFWYRNTTAAFGGDETFRRSATGSELSPTFEIQAVPEPSQIAMMGMAALFAFRRKR